MFQDILTYLYGTTILVVAAYAIRRYKMVDKTTRYIFFWIWLGLLTEALGYISIKLFQTNIPVYGVSSILEFILLCFYFNESVLPLKEKNIGIILAAAGILLGILNALFLQPLPTVNSNFLFLECLVIVCLALYALYRMFVEPDLKLWKETHFCFGCLIVFYECISLWNWGIYDYIGQFYPEKSMVLNVSLIAGNLLVYIFCGILIYLYPKMRQTYV